ncbi:MAG: toll/interleukin-1 receptor domain-containing protein [Cyclobacteriaceae bacterium]
MNAYKYQIVQLGYPDEYQIDLIKEVSIALRDLNILVDSVDFIDELSFSAKYKRNQACFGIYYANEFGNAKNLDEIETLIEAGVPILPVFKNSFSDEVPKALENQNGLTFSLSQIPKITNLILEAFGMLRSTRKVFISYRRNESTSVAVQLFEALERNNFDCFLDTHSIKQGEPFQDELWHRMTDCDVIVLLNTKGFLERKWCKEEIAQAGVKKIGVVQLIWPDNKLAATDEVCFPFHLSNNDFISGNYSDEIKSKLTDSIVDKIISEVESLRARNLASRREALITEFINSAKKAGRKMEVQPERFITESLPDNRRRLFIPSIGIPQSMDCQQSEEIRKEISEYEVERLHLIYDDLRIREKWVNHLDWLNGKLDVKTIKKQEFDSWLKN